MRPSREIYDSLVKAGDLAKAARLLSDDELRQVRGALARGDFKEWPADRVHGVCILEGCHRWEFPKGGEPAFATPNPSGTCDKCHGSEVAEP